MSYALVRFSHDNLPCIEPQDVRYVKVFDTFAEANSAMRDDLHAVDGEYGDRLGPYEEPGDNDDWAGVQIDPEVSGDVYEIQWIIKEVVDRKGKTTVMKYEAKIPKNDWKPDPIRKDKVDAAIQRIVNDGHGVMFTWYGNEKTPKELENLLPDEVRLIAERFVDAGWHVYIPPVRRSSVLPVEISKQPEGQFNLHKVERKLEVTNPAFLKL